MKYLLQIYPDMGLEEFAQLPADEQEAARNPRRRSVDTDVEDAILDRLHPGPG